MPLPILPIVLGGGALLFLLSKKKDGGTQVRTSSPYGTSTTEVPLTQADLSIRTPGFVPQSTGFQGVPLEWQTQIMNVLKELTVNEKGEIIGPVKAEAIQKATGVAANLTQEGHATAAQSLRNYANKAAKFVPASTPEETPPLATLGSVMQTTIQNALKFERDPGRLRMLARQVRDSFPSDRNAIAASEMLDALASQLESQQVQGKVLQEIDKVLQAPAQEILRKAEEVIPQIVPEISKIPASVPVPEIAIPQAIPATRSPIEVKADAVARHLIQVQAKYPVITASKGREDKSLIKSYQGMVGLTQDGLAGPGLVLSLAKNGVGTLPLVMYWPKSATSKNVAAFRSEVFKVATQREQEGDPMTANALRVSAAREKGQGGIVGALLS